MSSTLENAVYSVQGTIGTPMLADFITVNITSENGATDASAIALLEAIQGVVWPEGITATLILSKTDITQVSTIADMTATPPVFN